MEGIKFRGRAERCLSWVILDPVKPAATPVMSAMPRKRK